MRIFLRIQDAIKATDHEIGLDPELENVTSIIFRICEIIDENDAASFVISGCGEEKWPVDVLFDLPTFLEPLPENLQKLRNDEEMIVFELYEQGTERNIRFDRQMNDYAVSVEYPDGSIRSDAEVISSEALIDMLDSVRLNFLKLSAQIRLSNLARQELLHFLGSMD